MAHIASTKSGFVRTTGAVAGCNTWIHWTLLSSMTAMLATTQGTHAQIAAVPTSEVTALAAALKPSGLEITSITVLNGTEEQFGTYTNFSTPPVVFPDGVVLSSGRVASMLPGTSPSFNMPSTGWAPVAAYAGTTGAIFNYQSNNDAAVLEVHFRIASPSSVKFDFLFGSVEYPVYVNSYTDAFLAFLDGTAPENQICFDAKGAAVQVGQSFANRVTTADVNTAFGGTHGLIESLTTTTPMLTAGEHVLRFVVCDVNDGILDSAVFLANLRAESGSAGTEPTPFALRLLGPDTEVSPGSTYTLRASCTVPPTPLSGCQLAVHFDPTCLRLDAVNPVAGAPLSGEIAEIRDNIQGTLRYALGMSNQAEPLVGPSDLCDLVFTVLPGASQCGVSSLVTFGDVGPFTTRVTEAATAAPLVPLLFDSPEVKLDIAPPVLTGVPAANITVATDAGSTFGALVSLPTVTAVDACEGAVSVTVTGAIASGLYPIGTTTVTWSATDSVGNAVSVSRDIVVGDYQLLDLAVELQGFGIAPMYRSMRVISGGTVSTHTVNLTESVTLPGSSAVIAVRGVIPGIPVAVTDSLGCVAAKDPAHSLTAVGAALDLGARWGATVTPRQGDSNDDDMVEIVDYALWVTDIASGIAQDARSNFNGDTTVNTGDFGYINVNFFRIGDSCAPPLQSRQPRDRVSVKELRRAGLGQLVAADINGDGWVDASDMQQYAQQGGASTPAAAGSKRPSW